MTDDLRLNVLQVRQCVNMGDHADTVTNAVAVDPNMTVVELARHALMEPTGYPSRQEPIRDAYLTIRIGLSLTPTDRLEF